MFKVQVKYLILLVIGMIYAESTKSQDLIVKIGGDSIFCKVEKANELFVYFIIQKTKRGENEVLSQKEVEQIIYGFGDEPIRYKSSRGYNFLQVFGSITGSRIIASQSNSRPPEFSEYLDKLNWGIGFSTGFDLFLNSSLGIGISYSQSTFSNSIDVVQIGTGVIGKLSDEIRLIYAGGSIIYRGKIYDSESSIQLCIGLGYFGYSNNARIIYPFSLKGQAVGGHISGGVNLSLGSSFYLPIQFGLKGFSIDSYSLNFPEAIPDDIREDIETSIENSDGQSYLRIELNIGLMMAF